MSFGMRRQFKFTIGVKIYALIGLSFIGLAGVATLDSWERGASLKQQKQVELQHLTELALSILAEEYDATQKGAIPVAEAQKRSLERISILRYGGREFFFVTDMTPRVLMHPFAKQLVGQDVSGATDANGKHEFVEMVDVARRLGRGFVDYDAPKPGSDKAQPKLSHVAIFAPWNWIVGTGVYVDDLSAQVWASTLHSLMVAGLVMLITVAVSMAVARGITNPLHRMTAAMKALAGGRLDLDVPGSGRGDEIGEMAGAVEVFKSNAVARQVLEAEQKESEARATARRQADMYKMANDFEAAIGEIVETVSTASSKLELSAHRLSDTAERAEDLATTVAAASEKASTNVQSVASATEEMASSVTEISRQVQESALMAGEAVEQARRTNDRVSELSKAASRIGDVVELINSIAGQTNLLALNATIEAARAGEAGRGFAVVASEVKALAEQTARATDDIGQQVAGIQTATQESAGAIEAISATIGRLSEVSSAIAAAVEEQGAATQEISRNVQQAANGTQDVSTNITDVQRGATETGTASSEVLEAAQRLSSDSTRLKQEVGRFLTGIRTA